LDVHNLAVVAESFLAGTHRQQGEVRAMRRTLVIAAMAAIVPASGVASVVVFRPASTQTAAADAAKPVAAASVECCRCPKAPLPLPADAVDRAADQARIQAPFLYPKFGPAVVELAWRAVFRLQVWASTPFQCSNLVRKRTVVVDLLFPKMLPSASLSEGVVLVSLFKAGYRVWEVGH
jgi:hypothetical protein